MAAKSARQRAGAAAGELVLVGTDKAQLRKASNRNWTKAKERDFLSALAETCNVTQAAAEAGVSASQAYKKRKTDAAFRAGWMEAIATAYQRLELVLLDRAFNGTEKVVRRKDGTEERMLEYSNQLGLALLKMHGDSAVEGCGPRSELVAKAGSWRSGHASHLRFTIQPAVHALTMNVRFGSRSDIREVLMEPG